MKKLISTPWGKGVFISTIFVVVLAVSLWRPVLVIYHQQQAGKIIDEVASKIEGSGLISYRCFLGQFIDELPTDMDEAINHLLKAKEHQEKNSHTVYLLGQAYCLIRDYTSAIEVLREIQDTRKNNPNLHIESGFANFLLTLETDEKSNSLSDEGYQLKAQESFLTGNLSKDNFLILGLNAYHERNYSLAYQFFQIAEIFSELEFQDGYHAAISEMVVSEKEKFFPFLSEIPIITISGKNYVDLHSVFKLSEPKQISINTIEGSPTGVITSNFSDAFVIVYFQNDNKICISSMVLDRKPAPTEIQYEMDSLLISFLTLKNESEQWVKFEAETEVKTGFHILSLRFLNDAIINDIDRNVYFKDLEIEFCN